MCRPGCLITTPGGMPAAWRLASPKPAERKVAADRLAHAARCQAPRPGPFLDACAVYGMRGPARPAGGPDPGSAPSFV